MLFYDVFNNNVQVYINELIMSSPSLLLFNRNTALDNCIVMNN